MQKDLRPAALPFIVECAFGSQLTNTDTVSPVDFRALRPQNNDLSVRTFEPLVAPSFSWIVYVYPFSCVARPDTNRRGCHLGTAVMRGKKKGNPRDGGKSQPLRDTLLSWSEQKHRRNSVPRASQPTTHSFSFLASGLVVFHFSFLLRCSLQRPCLLAKQSLLAGPSPDVVQDDVKGLPRKSLTEVPP